MTHFAVIAPPYYSHFQALQALCVELIERGHRVTFFHQSDAAHWLSDPRIGFRSVGAGSHPPGSLEQTLRQAARPDTPWGLRRIIKQMAGTTAMLCNELPGAFADNGIEAVLCDQMEPAGGLVGESLGLPFISVACALPVNREPGLPLPVMPFAYASDERSQHMYRGSSQVYDWLMKPLGKVIAEAALRLGIAPRTALHECLSPLAQISQTLAGFDFPRSQLPANFHAVGPLRSPTSAQQGEWPIDRQKPFFFASLGTLQGDRIGLFERIASACRRLDGQLLIAHCGKLDAAQERRLIERGATWVTDFAPQQWALEQADAVITHGGLNTVMDAIAARTPMLVMPIAFDQPGVAARVAYRGVGSQLSRRASVSRIEAALRSLLAQPLPGFAPLIAELQQAGGVPRAADIVEAALLQSASVRAADL
ncbi:MGT family glycosyltransferase [Pseudomonas sp. BIGb0408]|uniref:MGT family glycosyltransferase n=1 Tax=Phytopseudomonas flavescens TaxID=29435 RepID=A0A7Y9XK56_9GAMM|nr:MULTISPECIES: glycosyltransferase [Pseudomonas]MCW2292698.1 MGT family glycosyltransferase [Pseudomonas sp. BIGb0408]NYH72732.1 MGT family glycosyltransferase [Pseudomonas flavescens]